MAKNKIDYTWGIERNPESKMFGKLVIGGKGMMPIIFWKSPGAQMDAKNVTGAAKHNQRVEIVSRTTFKGDRFVKVRMMVIDKGKKYPQAGWVARSLLKREGREIYG